MCLKPFVETASYVGATFFSIYAPRRVAITFTCTVHSDHEKEGNGVEGTFMTANDEGLSLENTLTVLMPIPGL